MKIFQSIPLVISGAAEHYNLNDKQLAISSSSHFGESNHIKILENWIKKISINQKYLQCGIHNRLNLNSSNNLLFSVTFWFLLFSKVLIFQKGLIISFPATG